MKKHRILRFIFSFLLIASLICVPAQAGEEYDLDNIAWEIDFRQDHVRLLFPVSSFGEDEDNEPDDVDISTVSGADVLDAIRTASGSDKVTSENILAFSFNLWKESGSSHMQPLHPLQVVFENLDASYFSGSGMTLHAYCIDENGTAVEAPIHAIDEANGTVTVEAATMNTVALAKVPHSDHPVVFAKIWSPYTKREPVQVRVTVPASVTLSNTSSGPRVLSTASSSDADGNNVALSDLRRVSADSFSCNMTFTLNFSGSSDAAMVAARAASKSAISDQTVSWDKQISEDIVSYSILSQVQQHNTLGNGVRYLSDKTIYSEPKITYDYDHMTVEETKLDGSPLRDSTLETYYYDSDTHTVLIVNVDPTYVNVKWIGYQYDESYPTELDPRMPKSVRFQILNADKNDTPITISEEDTFSVSAQNVSSNFPWQKVFHLSAPETSHQGPEGSWINNFKVRELVDANAGYEAKILATPNRAEGVTHNPSERFWIFNARLGTACVEANYEGFDGSYPADIPAVIKLTGEDASADSDGTALTLPNHDDDEAFKIVPNLSIYHLDKIDVTYIQEHCLNEDNKPKVFNFGDELLPTMDEQTAAIMTPKQYALSAAENPYYTIEINNNLEPVLGDYYFQATIRPTLRTLRVSKVWEDPSAECPVTLRLLRDGVDTGKTVTLDASGHFEGSFANLQKYNYDKPTENGGYEEYQYTVEEVTAGSWTAQVSGSMEDGFTVTNKKIPPEDSHEESSVPQKPAENSTKPTASTGTPRTGDASHTALWIVLLAASVCAFTLLYRRYRTSRDAR